jgi:hypothetical protein
MPAEATAAVRAIRSRTMSVTFVHVQHLGESAGGKPRLQVVDMRSTGME